jgi:1,4-dihydroxy-2-naphthoate octaprenyltransferase
MTRSELLLKLGRLRMTVFSAVTYAAATTLALEHAPGSEFSFVLFIQGFFFMLFCQLTAHFLGEFYDLESDKLNFYSSRFTGGSKVLVTGLVSESECFMLGCGCLVVAGTLLVGVLPSHVLPCGMAMLFISHQYSAPPFRLNHCGWGELAAAVVMNMLLPHFAALVNTQPEEYAQWNPFDIRLAILVVPSALLKFGLFLVLNAADRRADWLGGKNTLAVVWGEDFVCTLVKAAFSAVRCAFSDRILHSRMPLNPTHVRLKLLHAWGQWHSSRESTALTVVTINHVQTLKAYIATAVLWGMSMQGHGARFSADTYARGCYWIPRMFA